MTALIVFVAIAVVIGLLMLLMPKQPVIVPKSKSWLMRLLGNLLFWIDFDRYWTSFGGHIWVPDHAVGHVDRHRSILLHELKHLEDERRWLYLGFWLAYLLVPPLGPGFRAYFEFRGYRETLQQLVREGYEITDEVIDRISRQFTGPAYLWMWPFPSDVRRRLRRYAEEARRL